MLISEFDKNKTIADGPLLNMKNGQLQNQDLV